MYKKIALSLAFTAVTLVYFAQSKIVLEAESYFISEKYCEAADKCSQAYSKLSRKGNMAKKQKAGMAYKTAECYRFTERYREANEWYDRAILLDYQDIQPEVYFNNGEMLRMIGEFYKAVRTMSSLINLYLKIPEVKLQFVHARTVRILLPTKRVT